MSETEQGCPGCRRLPRELRALKAENRSRKDKPYKPKGSPGRKKGKGTFRRRKPPPESELKSVQVPLAQCPNCGGALHRRKRHEHIQSDIPPVEPVHIRFITQSGYCPHCKKRFRSRHPEQSSSATGAAGVSIGPNARAIAAEMKHRLGVSYEKIADMFEAIFNFTVSRSGLCRSGRRLALPEPVKRWSLTTLREKLVKIGAKVVRHARYVVFQMVEVAVRRGLFGAILERIGRLSPAPT